MPTVHQDIEVRSKGDQVLDQVTKKLGIMSKEGIGMGIAFSAVNMAMNLAQQALGGIMTYLQDATEMSRKFEMSLVRVSNAMGEFSGMGISQVKDSLLTMSVAFGENVNTLASGLQRFQREGANTADALQQLATAERLAIASGEDLETTSEALISSQEVFDLSASSSGYATEKLNQIWSKTGMSMSDISNIMGVSADKIHQNGLSMDDFVSILYELDEEGYKGRTMISQLKDTLDDYTETQKKVTDGQQKMNDAFGDMPDIASKLEKITGTKEFKSSMMQSLGAISQMNLGGWVDLESMFGGQRIADAKKYFDMLNTKGITTLEEFNSAAGKTAMQKLNPDFGVIGIPQDVAQLIRTFYFNNDQLTEQIKSETTGAIEDLNNKLIKNGEVLVKTTADIADYNTQLSDIGPEMEKLTAIHSMNQEQHYMELSMKSAAYASQIQDSATRNLINTLRQQQTEIDNLTRVNEEYNIISTTNSLEQMKMQLSSMSHGGRMTCEQKNKMKELERASLELRIKETENQLAIDKIKFDMTPEQQRLDSIKSFMSEELYIIQDTYQKEIQALKDKIATTNQLIADAQSRQTGAQTFIDQNTPGAPGSFTGNRGGVWRGGRQTGGPIFSTGLYTLHKGEYVVPKSGNNGATKTQVNIKIDLTIKNQDNAERLAIKIGQLIAQGYLTGVDCVYHLGG